MSSIVHWFGRLELKDWIAFYAAILSTCTAFIQFSNWRRNRPVLRVRFWHQARDKRELKQQHACVSVINKGDKSVAIYPPLLEVAQHTEKVSRIYRSSPDEIAENFNWIPLDYHDIEETFELSETSEQTYRFRLPLGSKLLSIRIVDRAGSVRLRRRVFPSTLNRAIFYVKHVYWLATKAKFPRENKPRVSKLS